MGEAEQPAAHTPPRAFTQGVGTVFQFTGVTLFLVFFFGCCFSALRSKEWGTATWRGEIGLRGPSGQVIYSERHVLLFLVSGGVVWGLALAGIGLGLQAQKRRAAPAAVGVSGVGLLFWLFQGYVSAWELHSIFLSLVNFGLAAVFGILLGLSLVAAREMAKNPPPAGQDLLPPDYREPFSQLSEESPEVRLARELAQRKQRLEVEQKEVEAMERRLKRKQDGH